MSYSLERLIELFESKQFVINNYFTLDGNYKLIELVNLYTASFLLVNIDAKYSIPAEKKAHEYQLHRKNVTGELESEPAEDTQPEYREIDHLSKALESEDKMNDLYDKPISLRGEENKSRSKFSTTYRQLNRFKLCVRNIPYKLALFDDDCICVLNEHSEIESYFISEYKSRRKKIFVTAGLKDFFMAENISQSIDAIVNQFYDILNTNQKIETARIQLMIEKKRSIQAQSKKIMGYKSTLKKTIQEYQAKHLDLSNKQQALLRKVKDLKQKNGTTEQTIRFDEQIQANNQILEEYTKKIIDSKKQLDEITLVVDVVLFDNMVMLTKIAENFKLLESVKM